MPLPAAWRSIAEVVLDEDSDSHWSCTYLSDGVEFSILYWGDLSGPSASLQWFNEGCAGVFRQGIVEFGAAGDHPLDDFLQLLDKCFVQEVLLVWRNDVFRRWSIKVGDLWIVGSRPLLTEGNVCRLCPVLV